MNTFDCIPMDATCKICGKPMKVMVDKDYAALSDPYGLLPMATHEACMTIMRSRQDAAQRLFLNCTTLMNERCDEDRKAKIAERLTIAARQYARAVCDQIGREDLTVSVDETVEQMMHQPSKVDTILRNLQGAVKYTAAQKELAI